MNYTSESERLLNFLPHKLQVEYALLCAESVFEHVLNRDKEAVRKCLDTTRLWLNDKATIDEVIAASTSASASAASAYAATTAYSAATTAYAAATTAYYAAAASATAYAYAFSAATYAYSATSSYAISKEKYEKKYYEMLLSFIDEKLSDLDKILLNIEGKL